MKRDKFEDVHNDPYYQEFLKDWRRVVPEKPKRSKKLPPRGNPALNRYQESLLLRFAWEALLTLREHWKELSGTEQGTVNHGWFKFRENANMIDLNDLIDTEPTPRNTEIPRRPDAR